MTQTYLMKLAMKFGKLAFGEMAFAKVTLGETPIGEETVSEMMLGDKYAKWHSVDWHLSIWHTASEMTLGELPERHSDLAELQMRIGYHFILWHINYGLDQYIEKCGTIYNAKQSNGILPTLISISELTD